MKRVGRDRFEQGDRLPPGQGRGGVLLDPGRLDRGDVLGGLPGDQPLGGELLVGAAEHGQSPGHGRRLQAGFEQGPLVELDVVGGDVQGVDALGPHVAHEVGEVAAVGLDGVVRQQGVADPGHEGAGGGRHVALRAAQARARKASTLAAAGASPSRTSVRSGRRGGGLGRTTSTSVDGCVLSMSVVSIDKLHPIRIAIPHGAPAHTGPTTSFSRAASTWRPSPRNPVGLENAAF